MSQGSPHLGPVCWEGSPLLSTVLPGFRKEPFPAAGLAYLSLFVTAPPHPPPCHLRLVLAPSPKGSREEKMGLGGGCETRGQDQAASQLAAGLLRPGQGVLGTSSGPPSPPLLVAPALPGGPGRAVAQALAMESMFEDDISILTQEALGPSEVWLDAPGDPSLGGDMCSASHFALITAYGDIKERLGGLERENATLRRRLKVYEIKVRTWR